MKYYKLLIAPKIRQSKICNAKSILKGKLLFESSKINTLKILFKCEWSTCEMLVEREIIFFSPEVLEIIKYSRKKRPLTFPVSFCSCVLRILSHNWTIKRKCKKMEISEYFYKNKVKLHLHTIAYQEAANVEALYPSGQALSVKKASNRWVNTRVTLGLFSPFWLGVGFIW